MWSVAVVAVLLVSAGLFAVEPTASSDPVQFGETVKLGLSDETVRIADARGYEIPRVQVFYAQYPFVVGYYGVPSFVGALEWEGHGQRFGPPVTVYVTDFSGTDPTLSPDGFVNTTGSASEDWIDAETAAFAVVERDGSWAIVPFSDRTAARAFATRYDGEVRSWSGVQALSVERPDETRMTDWSAARHARANESVRNASRLLDRPTTVVVGEDAPTVQAAVEAAPPNTTVRVPAGTYEERVTISKPLTLRGAGNETHLRGPGNGSAVLVSAPRTAITSLRVSGVGDELDEGNGTDSSQWDRSVVMTYGQRAAAIEFVNASHSLVDDVEIETPSNGVTLLRSPDAVVTDTTIHGNPETNRGFMGVLAMYSPAVIQQSTIVDGRDAVYSHRSHGLVVRNNSFASARFGAHLMYTSEALLADNVVREMNTGIVVMTRPNRNVLAGNDVRDSRYGLVVAGRDSYVADNVLADNRYGLKIDSGTSRYEGNVLARNTVGVQARSVVASNRVVGNDFVDNAEDVASSYGTLRVWSGPDGGNYWDTAATVEATGAMADRSYRPTRAVDRSLNRPGAITLARAPGLLALDSLTGTVPGMRKSGVVDERPLAEPANPVLLERAEPGADRIDRQSGDTTSAVPAAGGDAE